MASEAQMQWYWTSAKVGEAMGDVRGCMGTSNYAKEPKAMLKSPQVEQQNLPNYTVFRK